MRARGAWGAGARRRRGAGVIGGAIARGAPVGVHQPPPLMATTLSQITDLLDAEDLRYRTRGDDTVLTGFSGLPHYRDADGDAHLAVVIQLHEGGEYVQVFAPHAYVVLGEAVGPVLAACAQIQWRTKLIRFSYDPSDGELRPTVELPLEDAALTRRQLMRCMRGLVDLG